MHFWARASGTADGCHWAGKGHSLWERCANVNFATSAFEVVSKVASELFRASGIDEEQFSLSELFVSLEPRISGKRQTVQGK